MSSLDNLKACKDKRDLASLLHYDYRIFCWILYKHPIHHRYTAFSIPKKSGDPRFIYAPDQYLKKMQSNLSKLLGEIYEEINCEKNIFSFAFRKNTAQKKYGIYFNAQKHRNRKLVVNIDLKDFFHSIEFKRIVGFFIKDRNFQLNKDVAIGIAQIACYKDITTNKSFLPQGSPCSPIISNYLGQMLDARFSKLAIKYKFYYSRYADDITISFDTLTPSTKLLSFDSIWKIEKGLLSEIKDLGFEINLGKFTVRENTQRQQVTGLVVNKKINPPRPYYNYSKSMAYNYCKTGSYEKSKYHTKGKPNNDIKRSILGIRVLS